jgi:hypothetical protein
MPDKQQQGKEARDQKNYKDNDTWDPLARDKKSKHKHARGGGAEEGQWLDQNRPQLQIQVMGASKHVDDG